VGKMLLIWVFVILGLLRGSFVEASKAHYWLLTDLGTSARMIGYGGIEGFSPNADSMFDNPAGLYRVDQGALSLFSTQIIGQVGYFNGAIASRTPWGVFGVGYMHAVVGNIPHTAEDDNGRFFAKYNFDYKNTLIRGSYQYSVSDQIHLGASMTYYSNAFDEVMGRGSDVDFGAIYLDDRYELSFLVRNLFGREVDYGQDGSEKLSRQYTVSGKVPVHKQVDVMAQIKNTYELTLLSLGVVYYPELIPSLRISGGYKEFVSLNNVRNTFVVGFVFDFSDVEFHYAYEKSEHVDYNNKNYFSLSVKF